MLLKGSGVGRDYSAANCLVGWNYMPETTYIPNRTCVVYEHCSDYAFKTFSTPHEFFSDRGFDKFGSFNRTMVELLDRGPTSVLQGDTLLGALRHYRDHLNKINICGLTLVVLDTEDSRICPTASDAIDLCTKDFSDILVYVRN